MDKIGVETISLTLLGGETTLYPVIEFLDEANKHIKISSLAIISNISMPKKIIEINEYCKNNNIYLSVPASYHASQITLDTYMHNIKEMQDAGVLHITPYGVVNNKNFTQTMIAAENIFRQTGALMLLGRERELGHHEWRPLTTWQRIELSHFYRSKSEKNTNWLKGFSYMESGKVLKVSCVEEIYNILGFENIEFKGAICDSTHRIAIRTNGDVVFGSVEECEKKIMNILTDEKIPTDINGMLICPLSKCPCSCGSSILFK